MTIILTKDEIVRIVTDEMARKGYSVIEDVGKMPHWDGFGHLVLTLTMEEAG